jgi:putative transposase
VRSPFKYFNSSPEVIRLTVMLYVRSPLSLRDVEDPLAERGIDICHETVRLWWNRFGPLFATEIRKRHLRMRQGCPEWRWHLDDVFVKINGVTHYLWRAVDYEGEVLEAVATKRRDRQAALNFLKKLMKRYGRPLAVVTDKLRSYAPPCRRSVMPPGGSMLDAGSTIGRRTHTSRSDGEDGRCSASGGCEHCRNSPTCMGRSTTTSTGCAT